MGMKTYNPKDVVVIFGDAQLTGYAKDTFVKVTRDEDSWTLETGADGESVRSKSNNKAGKIEVTLMQSSPSNAILSAAHEADEIDGSGVRPAMVNDKSGNSLHAAEQSYVVKPADAEYANVSGTRTWIIQAAALKSTIGGN